MLECARGWAEPAGSMGEGLGEWQAVVFPIGTGRDDCGRSDGPASSGDGRVHGA
jgi:hypothetical protein